MVHCPDCGSSDLSSVMRYGQALCNCAEYGCEWWDDSEEQERDRGRELEDRDIRVIAEMTEAEYQDSGWRD